MHYSSEPGALFEEWNRPTKFATLTPAQQAKDEARRKKAAEIRAGKEARNQSMLKVPYDYLLDILEEYIISGSDTPTAGFDVVEIVDHLRWRFAIPDNATVAIVKIIEEEKTANG